MNLQKDTENDWTVFDGGKEIFIHKNDDGTFTNREKVYAGKGGESRILGTFPSFDAAYSAAQLYQ